MMLILESLATLYSYYGVMGIWGFKPWLISLFSFLPSPTVSVPILFTFLILLAASIIARRTIYGYSIYAIGSSYKAATASGVPIGKVTLITYSLSGFMGGLAWFMYSLQVGYIFAYTAGTIYLLDSIAVPVIGGIDIMGGTGYVPMLFIGALFVSTISNFIILMKINPLLEYAVKGIIIIVALIFSRLLKK
jgi:ribose/xylose/arabinose/galactoside ABC-type transport system permease subunit